MEYVEVRAFRAIELFRKLVSGVEYGIITDTFSFSTYSPTGLWVGWSLAEWSFYNMYMYLYRATDDIQDGKFRLGYPRQTHPYPLPPQAPSSETSTHDARALEPWADDQDPIVALFASTAKSLPRPRRRHCQLLGSRSFDLAQELGLSNCRLHPTIWSLVASSRGTLVEAGQVEKPALQYGPGHQRPRPSFDRR